MSSQSVPADLRALIILLTVIPRLCSPFMNAFCEHSHLQKQVKDDDIL